MRRRNNNITIQQPTNPNPSATAVKIKSAYRGILAKHTLYATGTTGRLIEEVTNLQIHKYLAGHLGGEQNSNHQHVTKQCT